MTTTPEWPAYRIGPRDAVFAIGVASTNFTQLESVLSFIFGTVFDLDMDASTMMPAKIGNEAAVDLIRRRLPQGAWGEPAKGHILHFLDAFNICLENRNSLLHSVLAWTGSPSTVLFKTSKQGKTHGSVPTLEELRAVADAMHTYTNFGRALGNWINNHRSDLPVFPTRHSHYPTSQLCQRRFATRRTRSRFGEGRAGYRIEGKPPHAAQAPATRRAPPRRA